jgi:membrane-anchored protein YejM (alkaline phosphatase superfamily)
MMSISVAIRIAIGWNVFFFVFTIALLIDTKYFFSLRLPNDSIAKFFFLQYKYSNYA